jgi:hypothetical protein
VSPRYKKQNKEELQRYVAVQVIGMQLAQAFTTSRSSGLRLRIRELDGVVRSKMQPIDDKSDLSVNVTNGLVSAAWLGEHRPKRGVK